MDLVVEPNGILICGLRRYRCALGRSGVRSDKREGDGATPSGMFPLREVYYRADRGAKPACGLPVHTLAPDDGWCDDPADPEYNRFVALPYGGRHERLWRDDALYDLMCVIGYNDAPVRSGLGSAIFLHVAAPDYAPTEGCVALAADDLRAVLEQCDAATAMTIRPRSL
jgi:L,D-peptidoglycan transpeptidase YkuD (ErfK/YbiS/YcfS/YnhG family)